MSEASFKVTEIRCEPYTDQRPGTAGLRKKVRVFQQPHYLETFVEAVFEAAALPAGATVVIGGDGRFYNKHAIQRIAEIAAARGTARLVIGQHGLLSTPAASHLIRKLGADGGFILTASHNPGGPDGDFGIKFNIASGGQAPESLTDAIYARSREVTGYRLGQLPALDLSRPGRLQLGGLTIDIVDPADEYARLMQQLFDFDAIAAGLRGGRRVCFDAMHGVTGPYARRIFGDLLGMPGELLLRAEPLPDFGGLHPDPNPVDAAGLVSLSNAPGAPDLLAASDGDGDRNMILGPGCFVSPGDSIAVLLAQHRQVRGYASGVPGVARSMPTSRAVDAVARELELPCYETPTGWRFFCNLLEAGRIGLCGEESFGTGSSHVREKDGIWAVLFWLSLLTTLRQSVPQILDAHWRRYGRHYYQRQDFQIDDVNGADRLFDELREALPRLNGATAGGQRMTLADEFTYVDPVDGSESRRQGIRLVFEDGSRIVYRLSGTGTAGATLRVYLERHVHDLSALHGEPGAVLANLAGLALDIARVKELTGVQSPSYTI